MEKQIELEDDEKHHIRAWKIKRVSWVLMLLTVAAAGAGFLGPGPYSKTTVQGPAGLALRYERIARYNAPAHFQLTIPAGREDVELSINSSFLEKVDVERIEPEPTEMRLEGDKHRWVFAREAAPGGSEIKISFRPERFGPAPVKLDFRNIGALEVKPFFLP